MSLLGSQSRFEETKNLSSCSERGRENVPYKKHKERKCICIPPQGVVLLKFLTFRSATALQHCKLIYAFGGGLGRLRHSPPAQFLSVPELCHFRLIQSAAICADLLYRNKANNSTSNTRKQPKKAQRAAKMPPQTSSNADHQSTLMLTPGQLRY